MEGTFKLKKVFSSRSCILEFDSLPIPLNPLTNQDITTDKFDFQPEGKVENIPSKLDYNQEVNFAN